MLEINSWVELFYLQEQLPQSLYCERLFYKQVSLQHHVLHNGIRDLTRIVYKNNLENHYLDVYTKNNHVKFVYPTYKCN